MLILSVDTSCSICRVGLFEDDRLLGEIAEDNKKSHSVKLMPMIEALLSEHLKKVSDVDMFAPVNGPGSYTGLRIGVTTCKLLGYSTSKPVVPVNTLDQLAYSCDNVSDKTIVCSCIDARNSRVFYSIYQAPVSEDCDNGKVELERLCEYDADEINVVSEKVKCFMDEKGALSVCFTGDGFIANKDFLKEQFSEALLTVSDEKISGSSEAICKLALNEFNSQEDKGKFDSKNTEVFYLRMPHITLKKDKTEA